MTTGSMLVSLGAWQDLATLGAETLRGMSSGEVEVAQNLSDFTPHRAVEIGMDATANLIELRLIIEIDEPGTQTLATALMGNAPGESLVEDMLREIANTLAGAFVRRALDDATEITLGLPETITVAKAHEHLEAAEVHHSVNLVALGSRVRLRFHVVGAPRDNVSVASEMLREGMIVANDVRAASGALLARCGTRLSAAEAEKVKAQLDPREQVLVAAGF